jgi:hypothetical protein
MKKILLVLFALSILVAASSCEQPEIAWHTATLLNGWTSQPNYQPIEYGKDSMGQVHLRGTAYNGSAPTSSTVFMLPDDYLPSYDTSFPVTIAIGAGTSATGYLFIYTKDPNKGKVNANNSSGGVLWVYLGEIEYSTN